VDPDDPIEGTVWEGPHERRVERAQDHGIEPDGQRHDEAGAKAEPAIGSEGSSGLNQLASKPIGGFPGPLGSVGRGVDPDHLAANPTTIAVERLGPTAGLGGREALALELFGSKLDMELELFVHLGRTEPPGRQPEDSPDPRVTHQALAAATIFATTATYRRHSASSASSWSRPALVSW
jgi:hypothetical protein